MGTETENGNTVRLGQRVKRYPVGFGERENGGQTPKKAQYGTVVYIHPKGRFHVVEFAVRCGVIRESFKGVAVTPIQYQGYQQIRES